VQEFKHVKPKKGEPSPFSLSDSVSHNQSNDASHRLPGDAASRGIDPRQQRSALALRNALLRLLKQKDFDEITVREIVTEAGVNNATFFRHHPDKKTFLNRVAQDEIDRLVAVSIPSGHGLEGYVVLCEYVRENRALWSALLTGGAAGVMRDRYARLARSIAAEYVGVKSWLPHELSVIASTALIVETISWWLTLEDEAYSPQEIAEILERLVAGTIMRSPAGRKGPHPSGSADR
jgi:AcrR family transcriptional regulator